MVDRRERLVLVLPLLLVLLPFLLWPVTFGFLASFTNYSPHERHLRLIGLANYASLARDGDFLAAFRTIAVFLAVAVPAELLIGFAVAWLLREPFRGRTAIRVALLVPWFVSPVAGGVMWHFLYSTRSGLLNYFLSWLHLASVPSPLSLRGLALPATILVEVWRTAPLVGFLLLPGLISIPRSLWEEATIQGVSAIRQVRCIVLPYLRPLLLAVGMLLVGGALGTFDLVLILTNGGPGSETLTPALFSYQRAFRVSDWPLSATSAWFIVAAVALASLAYLLLSRPERRLR